MVLHVARVYAHARGAPVLAEVLGGSYSCDAHHMTEPLPDGQGVALAIDRALAHAGIEASAVDYVNAHATSTPAGDMAELRVLQAKFGKNPGMKINSTKCMTGHLLGAASAVGYRTLGAGSSAVQLCEGLFALSVTLYVARLWGRAGRNWGGPEDAREPYRQRELARGPLTPASPLLSDTRTRTRTPVVD